jgi:enoyl-[acyl-carrier protein] reductase I
MSFEGLMKGKRGLIMGVANQHSIAWGIAQALHAAGAELAFSYQGDLFRKRVVPLVEPMKPAAMIDCDVSDPKSIDAGFAQLSQVWDRMDFLVHAIAFSDKEQLKGRYLDTTPENFRTTMDISCYSFTAVAQRAEKLMGNGGAMLTLTYYGAERVMPHYNVMGVAKAALEASVRYMAEDLGKKAIRVNAVSAGPIKTLAFAGIADGRYILKWNEYNSPLRRSVTQGEVGNAALFLLSDLGSAVTGETLHVDAGYHVVGMKAEDAPDINVQSDKAARTTDAP